MTIAKAFAKYMEDQGYGTRGTDIFIDAVPKETASSRAWWIVSGGGTPTIKAQTGERMKQYLLNVFFRNTDSDDVDETLQQFEEFLNGKNCNQLDEYDTIEIEAATFQSDQDLDQEDRTVGLLQAMVTVYQS